MFFFYVHFKFQYLKYCFNFGKKFVRIFGFEVLIHDIKIQLMFAIFYHFKYSHIRRLLKFICSILHYIPTLRQDGLMVSMSASHVLGHGFTPEKGHYKMLLTALLLGTQTLG